MKVQITTLVDNILRMQERQKSSPAVMTKKNREWQSLNWQDYFQQIELCAFGLLNLGLKKGDRIAIFANTRLEWSLMDHACLGLGAIVVPIYQTVTAEDLEYTLNNSSAKFLVVENYNLQRVFEIVKDRCPSVEVIVSFEKPQEKSTTSWEELLENGSYRKKKNPTEFIELCKKITADDIATILYTSGTTGQPKGVVLTHRQAVSEITEAFTYAGAREDDVSLTFLPYAHILGRIEHWGHAYIGYTMAFAESVERIRSNLTEISPTIMVAVPRIFEKIYAAIWSQVESNFASRRVFRWALSIGLRAGDYRLRRAPIPMTLLAEYKIAQNIALDKVKDAFGGRLRFAISGGAPISKDIALFFHACGVLILEGYGLTETTGAITVNAPFDYRFGSVGKPIGDTKIKIAEDGEILIHSAKVMREYYQAPEATAEALENGWFHTGDIGEITTTGDLRITDRKKDLIKTAGGKYVAPQRLENLLKNHSFISNVLIHGDQKKFIVALLTLDKAQIIHFAKEQGISYADYPALTQSRPVQEMVRKAVAETNSQLAPFETIKRFGILANDFTVEAGELTPSLKVKRKVLDKKYAQALEALYQ